LPDGEQLSLELPDPCRFIEMDRRKHHLGTMAIARTSRPVNSRIARHSPVASLWPSPSWTKWGSDRCAPRTTRCARIR
jgi:hypothetical protein